MAVGDGFGSIRGVALATLAIISACNPAPDNVSVRRLQPIQPGSIRRIAVLPFTEAALQRPPVPGQEPLPEPPGDTVTRLVIDAMRRYPDWQITDSLVVGEAFRRLYGEVRAPTADEARAVGKVLGVDSVVRGQVSTFDERIGTEIAAERPARVDFAVELVRIPSGEVMWQGEYDEQQQALSDNFWNLGGFLRAGATWLRARELTALGAEQVVARMHDALFGGDAAAAR
jgi:TolB-like protein